MTKKEAALIALGMETAELGRPTKMPGYSFGLSAFQCQRGSELSKDPTTICAHCYARSNYYLTYHEVINAHKRRFAGIRHPQWVEAMVTLILDSVDPKNPYFRWHDSGDLQGLWHLKNIVNVAMLTPNVRHWLPTHEFGMVQLYLNNGGNVPENLCIRFSADRIGEKQFAPDGINTSTVHRGHGAMNVVQVSEDRADSVECKAGSRGAQAGGAGLCGQCRACWDKRVKNVSYPIHGERKGKYQMSLPVIQ